MNLHDYICSHWALADIKERTMPIEIACEFDVIYEVPVREEEEECENEEEEDGGWSRKKRKRKKR